MERKSLADARFYNRAFFLFTGGFIAGLILIYAGWERLVGGSAFLDLMSLQRIGTLEPDRMRLLLYCLKERFRPAVLLVLLAVAGAGSLAVCLYLVWSGFCAGVVLSVLSLRYGIRGVLLFAGGIFPQALFLVPAYLMLFRWCVISRRMGGGGGNYRSELLNRSGKLLLALAFLAVGCVVESYLNPILLKWVFRLF